MRPPLGQVQGELHKGQPISWIHLSVLPSSDRSRLMSPCLPLHRKLCYLSSYTAAWFPPPLLLLILHLMFSHLTGEEELEKDFIFTHMEGCEWIKCSC